MVDAPGLISPVPVSPGIDEPQLALGRGGPLFLAHADLLRRLDFVFTPKQFTRHIVPARMGMATWKRLATRLPFLAVGWIGLEPIEGSLRKYTARAIWTIFVGTRQPTPAALLTGDAAALGQFGVAGLAVAALHGHTLPGVGSWRAGAATNVYDEAWADDDTAVMAIEASMEIQIDDPAAAAALPDFTALTATWSWDRPDPDAPNNPLWTRDPS